MRLRATVLAAIALSVQCGTPARAASDATPYRVPTADPNIDQVCFYLPGSGAPVCDRQVNKTTGAISLLPSTVPYPGVNATFSALRLDVGGLNPLYEFPHLAGATNYSTAVISGTLVIPSGSYTGATSQWPDYPVVGTVLNDNTSKTGVALFGFAGIGANGASAEGSNVVVTNCELAKPSCAANGGYDVGYAAGYEADLNAFTKPGGVAPSGGWGGFRAVMQAPVATNSSAFDAVATGAGPFNGGFTSENGAALVALSVGTLSKSPTYSASQPIYFNSFDGAGAHVTSLQFNQAGTALVANTIFQALGGFSVTGTGNVAFDARGMTIAQGALWANDGIPVALSSDGTAQIKGNSSYLYFSKPLVTSQTTPPASAATCTAGEIVGDASYLYECTSANTWKRAALSTW